MPFPLSFAQKLAERIAAELEPYCDRIAIAGSIRRRKAWVNDIDLVALPKAGCEGALRERIKRNTRAVISGDQTIVVELRLPGRGRAGAWPEGDGRIQLDIWLAHHASKDLFAPIPGNWGTLLLCRTGSREHNIFLAQRAQSMGLKWNPHHGVYGPIGWPEIKSSQRSAIIASESEADIYRTLNLAEPAPDTR